MCVLVGVAFGGLPALAFEPMEPTLPAAVHQSAPDLLIGSTEPVLQPFAHVLFCKRHAEDCAQLDRRQTSQHADEMSLIAAINLSVNGAIAPRHDNRATMGGDVWSLAPRTGDCEDYAITKRHQLLAEGFPSSALRLALTQTPRGEGHMVLVVRTSKGDVVLDNRSNAIMDWRETNLTWMDIQSDSDPRLWFRVG